MTKGEVCMSAASLPQGWARPHTEWGPGRHSQPALFTGSPFSHRHCSVPSSLLLQPTQCWVPQQPGATFPVSAPQTPEGSIGPTCRASNSPAHGGGGLDRVAAGSLVMPVLLVRGLYSEKPCCALRGSWAPLHLPKFLWLGHSLDP